MDFFQRKIGIHDKELGFFLSGVTQQGSIIAEDTWKDDLTVRVDL